MRRRVVIIMWNFIWPRSKQLSFIPTEANMGLSCGNPTAMASIRSGEGIADLGSGGGLDVFLASELVGPQDNVVPKD